MASMGTMAWRSVARAAEFGSPAAVKAQRRTAKLVKVDVFMSLTRGTSGLVHSPGSGTRFIGEVHLMRRPRCARDTRFEKISLDPYPLRDQQLHCLSARIKAGLERTVFKV